VAMVVDEDPVGGRHVGVRCCARRAQSFVLDWLTGDEQLCGRCRHDKQRLGCQWVSCALDAVTRNFTKRGVAHQHDKGNRDSQRADACHHSLQSRL
jgi:hypothetical protein